MVVWVGFGVKGRKEVVGRLLVWELGAVLGVYMIPMKEEFRMLL